MNLIIIGILLIMTILSLFFKVDLSRCYCGIFAFSGKRDITPAQISLAMMKFKLLGLYNQSRGVHGCGTFTDGQILKGADKEKLFEKFIEVNDLPRPAPDGNKIMIGHCRQASRGAQNLANTHPFLINEDLVGVHNGTVTNTWDISKRHNIAFKDYDVDSQLMFMTLEKGDIDMLNMYEGAAALVWARKSEPNKMFVYHGASRDLKDGTVFEERPLYFVEEEEGTYFSSMENSLFSIQDGESKICCLKYNKVFTIEDGIFTGEFIEIDRENANVKAPYNYYSSRDYADYDDYKDKNRAPNYIPRANGAMTYSPSTAYYTDYEGKIFKETLPLRALNTQDCVYFHKGRFHMPNGDLCDGPVHLMKKGIITSILAEKAKTVFFIRGVMLKNVEDYNLLKSCAASPNSYFQDPKKNLAMFLSRYSEYPITNYTDESQETAPYYRFSWFKDGARVTTKDNFTPKYGGRHYSFENGFLFAISSSNKKGAADNSVFYTDSDLNTDSLNLPIVSSSKIIKTSDFLDAEYEVFDQIFDDVQEAMYAYTESHVQTLKTYVNDFMIVETNLDPDDEEVWNVVLKHLAEACEKQRSIREQLRDTNENLDFYYDMIKEQEAEAQLKGTQQNIPFNAAKADIENNIDKAMEEHESLKDAGDVAEDVIENLEDLISQALELTKNDHDFAQEFANKLYRGIDSLKHQLAEVATTFKQHDLIKKINNLNSSVI